MVEFLQEPGGQGGITLQRMAARPATGIAAQLEELQRKYRIMGCDRKSYAEEVEAVLRKQKLQNEKLRRESQSLKAELSLEAFLEHLWACLVEHLQVAADSCECAHLVRAGLGEDPDVSQRARHGVSAAHHPVIVEKQRHRRRAERSGEPTLLLRVRRCALKGMARGGEEREREAAFVGDWE